VLFSVGTAGTIWLIFFLMFVIIRMRFLCKEKLGQLQRKVEKFEQTAKIIILNAFSIITDDRNDIFD
jgi:hypothetical protein